MTFSTASHPDRFEDFYQSWFPKAVAIARRKGLSDAESAAQEVLMVFFTQDYLDPEGRWSRWHDDKFDSWVASILYRRLVSLQRKELRRNTIAPEVAIGERQIVGPSEEIFTGFGELKDLVKGVQRELSRERPDLLPLWVEIVRQFTFGDMNGSKISQKNLAEEMGVSASTVSALMAELREWLRCDAVGITGELIDRTFETA